MQIITTNEATSRMTFYRLDALPDTQPTVSKHWRENITFHGLAHPKLTWGSSVFVLTTNSSWLPWGRVSKPLISLLTPVSHSRKYLLTFNMQSCCDDNCSVEIEYAVRLVWRSVLCSRCVQTKINKRRCCCLDYRVRSATLGPRRQCDVTTWPVRVAAGNREYVLLGWSSVKRLDSCWCLAFDAVCIQLSAATLPVW